MKFHPVMAIQFNELAFFGRAASDDKCPNYYGCRGFRFRWRAGTPRPCPKMAVWVCGSNVRSFSTENFVTAPATSSDKCRNLLDKLLFCPHNWCCYRTVGTSEGKRAMAERGTNSNQTVHGECRRCDGDAIMSCQVIMFARSLLGSSLLLLVQ